jgi:HD superfamily phosphohydrolase
MEANRGIDLRVLAYLICHTRREELSDIISDPALVEALDLLANLVSGVVDIDRLDHYIRDLFFTGTALSSFNVFKLLNAIYLDQNNGSVNIDEDAIPQAFNLLHSKEHLRRHIFENPKNMAFNAMLNFCVSSYIKADQLKELTCKYNYPQKTLSELLTLTDGQLLSELDLVNKPLSISQMVSLIRMGEPYQLLDSIPTVGLRIGQTLEQRAEFLSSYFNLSYLEDDLPKAIFSLQDSKGKVSLLSMDKLFYLDKNAKHTSIIKADGYEYFVRHLSFESEDTSLRCWVFIRPRLKEDEIKTLKEKLSTLVNIK